ncbi:hypothetical protein VNO80_11819 [Phaseolus coccineus]|uniref:Dehydrin n=1 Tax=Phaseolus coccineus TaxID=3886 RepID=A0AAN9NG02_PHACN
MASAQCYKTREQTYQQKNQHPSIGQKVSELFKGHHNHPNEVKHTTQCSSQTKLHSHSEHHNHPNEFKHTTQCSSQTKLHSHSGHSTTKTGAQCSCSKTLTNTKSQDTYKRGHKKGLVQNIKDRFSEHDGSSSSSSESESDSGSDSDNENCRKRKD